MKIASQRYLKDLCKVCLIERGNDDALPFFIVGEIWSLGVLIASWRCTLDISHPVLLKLNHLLSSACCSALPCGVAGSVAKPIVLMGGKTASGRLQGFARIGGAMKLTQPL